MNAFQKLTVWQKAHQLVLETYHVSQRFPQREVYGLTQQLRRAVSSVPTNIVEGSKRQNDREFANFVRIAEGSLEETKYHLLLARDLTYLSQGEFQRMADLCDEVGRMLHGFRQRLLS